ncbi:MAG TPA: DciA family protein [Patescibacteria group bacterium]|nr:DciA family protein [Patescibacteria group bacterium]
MDSLANIFSKHKRSPILKKVQASLLVERANDLIKDYLNHHGEMARAVYIKDNTLAVACLSSVVAQELKLREMHLLNALNKDQTGQKITTIKFLL